MEKSELIKRISELQTELAKLRSEERRLSYQIEDVMKMQQLANDLANEVVLEHRPIVSRTPHGHYIAIYSNGVIEVRNWWNEPKERDVIEEFNNALEAVEYLRKRDATK